jgi:hypothetical protein
MRLHFGSVAIAVERELRVVFDEEYRVVELNDAAESLFSHLLGEPFWDHYPSARAVFLPYCEEARRTGGEVELVTFFEGSLKRVRYEPDGPNLAATWEVLATIDVSSLDALQESLRDIASALAQPAIRGSSRPILSVVEGGAALGQGSRETDKDPAVGRP